VQSSTDSNRATTDYRHSRMQNCRWHDWELLPTRLIFLDVFPRENRQWVFVHRVERSCALLVRVNKSVMDIVGNVNSQICSCRCGLADAFAPDYRCTNARVHERILEHMLREGHAGHVSIYSFVKHSIRTVIHELRKKDDL